MVVVVVVEEEEEEEESSGPVLRSGLAQLLLQKQMIAQWNESGWESVWDIPKDGSHTELNLR